MHSKSPSSTLAVITGNKGKAAEIEAILGIPVDAVNLEITEIQSLDVSDVARAKATAAYRLLGRPVVVDDTGMSIECLEGLPGALVSWFLDKLGPAGILRLVASAENRRASVMTCIGYANGEGVETYIGQVDGTISTELRGTNGFGYDPIFIPDGQSKTYAEMTSDEKNSISMRKEALVKLKSALGRSTEPAAAG